MPTKAPLHAATGRPVTRQTTFRLFCHFGAQDLDILPAFFRHYTGLGVSSFHFVVHGDRDLAKQIESTGQGRRVEISDVVQGPFEETKKCRALTAAIRPFAGEWVLLADTDEFLELPYRDLPTTVRALNAFGLTSLPGQLVDRMSFDGSLPEIGADDDLEKVFPNLSRTLYGEMAIEHPPWQTKFPLFLVFDTTTIQRGHHLPPNDTSPMHAPVRATVHHFKWRAALLRSFERQQTVGGNGEGITAYHQWLETREFQLPTNGAVPYSREILFDMSLLRQPNRRQISTLVLNARRARIGRYPGEDARLAAKLRQIEIEWETRVRDPRELRVGTSGLLGPKGHIAFATFELAGPTRGGGIGTAIAAAAERLAADGHRVSVLFCLLNRPPPEQPWLEYWSSRGVHVDTLAVPDGLPFHQQRPRTEIGHEVLCWLKRIDPDIVHFHDCLGFGAIACAAKRQGLALTDTRLIVQTHGSTTWHKRGNQQLLSVDELYTAHAETEQLHYADGVISPSGYMLDWLVENGAPLPEHATILRNLQGGEARASVAAARDDWRPRELTFFGRVEFRKGIDIFCEAISILTASGQRNFTVTVLGRMGDTDDVERFVRDAAENSAVPWRLITSYGTTDAVSYLRGARTVAVMPSRVDNAPYTIYECLENGIPFISSSTGGIPELIAEKDHARVLRADSAGDLAAALAETLDSGHAPAKPAFDPEDVDLHWLAWHGEVLEDIRKSCGSGEAPPPATPSLALGFYGEAPAPIAHRAVNAASHQSDVICKIGASEHVASLFEKTSPLTLVASADATSDGGVMNRLASMLGESHILFCHASVLLEENAARVLYDAMMASDADAAVCSYWLQFVSADEAAEPVLDRFIVHAPAGPQATCPIRNVFGAPAFLIRKSAFERVGRVDERLHMRGVEHWDLLNRLSQSHGTIASVPVPLATHFLNSIDHPLLRAPEQVTESLLAPYVDAAPFPLKEVVGMLPLAIKKGGYVPDLKAEIEGRFLSLGAEASPKTGGEHNGQRRAADFETLTSEMSFKSPPSPPETHEPPESNDMIDGPSRGELLNRIHHVTRMYHGLSMSRATLLRQFLRVSVDRILRRRPTPPWKLD